MCSFWKVLFLLFREVRFNSCVRCAFFAFFLQTCTKIFLFVVWSWFKVRSIDMILKNILVTFEMFIGPFNNILGTHEVKAFGSFHIHLYQDFFIRNFYSLRLDRFSWICNKKRSDSKPLKNRFTFTFHMIRSALGILEIFWYKKLALTPHNLTYYCFWRLLRKHWGRRDILGLSYRRKYFKNARSTLGVHQICLHNLMIIKSIPMNRHGPEKHSRYF